MGIYLIPVVFAVELTAKFLFKLSHKFSAYTKIPITKAYGNKVSRLAFWSRSSVLPKAGSRKLIVYVGEVNGQLSIVLPPKQKQASELYRKYKECQKRQQ